MNLHFTVQSFNGFEDFLQVLKINMGVVCDRDTLAGHFR